MSIELPQFNDAASGPVWPVREPSTRFGILAGPGHAVFDVDCFDGCVLGISGWDSLFENAATRKMKNGVSQFFLNPVVGCDSRGYVELVGGEVSLGDEWDEVGNPLGLDGKILGVVSLGVFQALVQLMAALPRSVRETDEFRNSNGSAMTVTQLATRIRMDRTVVVTALRILASDAVGWVTSKVLPSDSQVVPKAVPSCSQSKTKSVQPKSTVEVEGVVGVEGDSLNSSLEPAGQPVGKFIQGKSSDERGASSAPVAKQVGSDDFGGKTADVFGDEVGGSSDSADSELKAKSQKPMADTSAADFGAGILGISPLEELAKRCAFPGGAQAMMTAVVNLKEPGLSTEVFEAWANDRKADDWRTKSNKPIGDSNWLQDFRRYARSWANNDQKRSGRGGGRGSADDSKDWDEKEF